MKKIALYPGSFNPLHEGHEDVIKKALMVFDEVYVMRFINPDKEVLENILHIPLEFKHNECIKWGTSKEMVVDHINHQHDHQYCAVIKGLRNGQDLEYETAMQYWNEDLGITIPTFYVITDRKFRHISSSAIRQVEKFKK